MRWVFYEARREEEEKNHLDSEPGFVGVFCWFCFYLKSEIFAAG